MQVAESIGAKNVIYTSAFTKHNCDVWKHVPLSTNSTLVDCR